ncbi:HNH endonuclease [Helicobacter suis]|uniref:HNH endonuclease n=1 Tax=Helicobacter suis TaxID=104628 RepID=UPI0013D455FD|nr:HNH endonuclease [Helicobacter suis]
MGKYGKADVDTEQLRQAIQIARLFIENLLHQRTRALMQALQEYYKEVSEEYKQAHSALGEAQKALEEAKKYVKFCEIALALAYATPEPWTAAAVAAASAALAAAKSIQKECERKVQLLEEAVEIYTEQIKQIETLLQEIYAETKDLLLNYEDHHNQLCKRVGLASETIEQDYSIPPPEIQQLLALQYLQQQLLEHTLNASQQPGPDYEQERIQRANENYKAFLQERQKSFINAPDNDLNIPFSEHNLPIFPAAFSTTIPYKDLGAEKSLHHFHGIKALQKALEKQPALQELFDEQERLQIHKGITPKGYLWHFDANPPLGNLQLVREEVLLKVPHTKGYPLWQEWKQGYKESNQN